LLRNAVKLPIKPTKPFGGDVHWCSMGSGGGFHDVSTPFELLQARASPLVISLHLKDIRYLGAAPPFVLPRKDQGRLWLPVSGKHSSSGPDRQSHGRRRSAAWKAMRQDAPARAGSAAEASDWREVGWCTRSFPVPSILTPRFGKSSIPPKQQPQSLLLVTFTTGSRSSCQPSALYTLPGRIPASVKRHRCGKIR